MSDDKLHPSVREFKVFMNKHPKLIEEVRKSGRGWQEYYEKWALLGEDDPVWDSYKKEEAEGKSKEGKGELFGQLMKLSENVDIDKVQKQVHQLSNTITTIQDVLGQFQTTKTPPQQFRKSNNPFNWGRD
ncbi:Putative coat protein [Virgibacillus subterraneus]|uniref:Coat protein n=1 Tax=Virgibacillus subterraneus TaxID=621109 RepID=A0A1H9HI43_9BACI|nr:YlbD family protein [Virgibacillus subterraneus]SEQ61892.1 Putative coat protein [Virgibacillus subterraneus]